MAGQHPFYELSRIQHLARLGDYLVTRQAQRDSAALGIPLAGILACLAALTEGDFYKTMESERIPGLWQDAYRPTYSGLRLYVKLQIGPTGNAVVVSFKEL